jgi:cyclopropane fatty-acyl-phospholipid synthase-like methyltransferase
MRGVPPRIARAVEALDVRPSDRLLEFGCGPGVSVAQVCARLGEGGSITAIDRSATAVNRTRTRVADCIAAGRAVVHQAPFEASALAGLVEGPFDKIFSINVNLYWTGQAAPELSLARSLLAPGGRLYAFYEGPSDDRTAEVARRVADAFRVGGFTPTVSNNGVLCVAGI